jgi:hypothetical protein
MVKIREVLSKIFSPENTEFTKTISESGKAVQENRCSLRELQPYIGQLSSVLDALNSPLVQVPKEAIPFAPLVMTLLQLAVGKLNRELSLEECIVFVTQAAYLKSFQAEFNKRSDWSNSINLQK